MKRFALLFCALCSAVGAFADYGYYGYSSSSDQMSGFEIFTLLVMIVYIFLSIVILVRWWKMTSDVEQIRQTLTNAEPKITYLVAIGETEKAKKAALKMVVDTLYPIYHNPDILTKAEDMNKALAQLLPKIKKLGIEIPEYATSGEKFIDYMNSITDNTVSYKK